MQKNIIVSLNTFLYADIVNNELKKNQRQLKKNQYNKQETKYV